VSNPRYKNSFSVKPPEIFHVSYFKSTFFELLYALGLLLHARALNGIKVFGMDQISKRARSSTTDYQTGIPDIFDNVYDAKTNPSGIISLALSENVSI
jgi:hypothetical protein